MFQGGYASIDHGKFGQIEGAMSPVSLNPDARYLVAKSSHPKAKLADETRFGMALTDLLDAGTIESCESANPNDGEKLAPGDMLSVLNFGFVEFMDVMGTDDDIADAARTSYTGGKSMRKNKGLIRYLLRHLHTTPFEMGELKFRLYIPMFVYRQLFRHRTASQLEPAVADCITNDTAFQTFSVQNEMSGRYVEMPDHYFLPEVATVEIQSTDNKQGRSEGGITVAEQQALRDRYSQEVLTMRKWYRQSLEQGVAKELSRANLPLSQYTLLIWKIDLKNLLHFISLRIHPHAQYEVREYARALLAVVRSCFPLTCEAFEDYHVGGVRFSATEMEAMKGALPEEQRRAAYEAFCAKSDNGRERSEFAEKLGLVVE